MNFVFAGNPASFAANNPPVIAGFEQNLLNGTSRNTQLYSPLKYGQEYGLVSVF